MILFREISRAFLREKNGALKRALTARARGGSKNAQLEDLNARRCVAREALAWGFAVAMGRDPERIEPFYGGGVADDLLLSSLVDRFVSILAFLMLTCMYFPLIQQAIQDLENTNQELKADLKTSSFAVRQL